MAGAQPLPTVQVFEDYYVSLSETLTTSNNALANQLFSSSIINDQLYDGVFDKSLNVSDYERTMFLLRCIRKKLKDEKKSAHDAMENFKEILREELAWENLLKRLDDTLEDGRSKGVANPEARALTVNTNALAERLSASLVPFASAAYGKGLIGTKERNVIADAHAEREQLYVTKQLDAVKAAMTVDEGVFATFIGILRDLGGMLLTSIADKMEKDLKVLKEMSAIDKEAQILKELPEVPQHAKLETATNQ